jgi:hypothetical protein
MHPTRVFQFPKVNVIFLILTQFVFVAGVSHLTKILDDAGGDIIVVDQVETS